MSVFYELWDLQTNNAINWFDTEDAALQRVAEEIAIYGEDAVALWGLSRGNNADPDEFLAQGAALAACARAAATPAGD